VKLGLVSDHAGFVYKAQIADYLNKKGYEVEDYGCFSDESCDYPDFAHPFATDLESGVFSQGIALCGSGNGISITLNKHQKVRAALCWKAELAQLARQHNDANVLSIPARFISMDEVFRIIDAFLSSKFEGGRHQRRVDKIPLIK